MQMWSNDFAYQMDRFAHFSYPMDIEIDELLPRCYGSGYEVLRTCYSLNMWIDIIINMKTTVTVLRFWPTTHEFHSWIRHFFWPGSKFRFSMIIREYTGNNDENEKRLVIDLLMFVSKNYNLERIYKFK